MIRSRLYSILALSILTCSLLPVTGMRTSGSETGANHGFTEDEIEASEVKPKLTVSKIDLNIAEAEAGSIVPVGFWLDGAQDNYAYMGIHFNVDSRLKSVGSFYEVGKDFNKEFSAEGRAFSYLSKESDSYMCVLACSNSNANNSGTDGLQFITYFSLPQEVSVGDVFPIDVYYHSKDITSVFTNVMDDERGQLMGAYLFTKGIFNEKNPNPDPVLADYPEADGYIRIVDSDTKIVPEFSVTMKGDANCDDEVNMADAVLVMQALSNPDDYGFAIGRRYGITKQGILNADVYGDGDGITIVDAQMIQSYKLGIIDSL